MRPTRPAPESDPAWNPGLTGHALFTTRLGVCGVAWGGLGVVAVMLPDTEPATTRERLLASAGKRRTGDWRQALSVQDLSADALQAVAGVQTLLAGRAGVQEEPQGWALAQPQFTAAGMVLPDMREQLVSARRAPNGLPLLDDIAIDWHGVPEFARHVYRLALAIAPGHTRSYGDLAAELGGGHQGRGLARAVGQALGANPLAPLVPCHRILAAQGGSGGFSASGGTRTKLSLLEGEGAALGDGSSLPLFG